MFDGASNSSDRLAVTFVRGMAIDAKMKMIANVTNNSINVTPWSCVFIL